MPVARETIASLQGSECQVCVQDMEAMKGKSVVATITEVNPSMRKVVLSVTRAEQYQMHKQIKLGALLWGTVRSVRDFGVFIGLDNTRISGLLHVSNISRARVDSVEVSALL